MGQLGLAPQSASAPEARPLSTARRGRVPWYVSSARVRSKAHERAKLADILSFFRQLRTLVAGGTTLLQSIEVCAENSESFRLQKTLKRIARQVASGAPFNVALGSFPDIFDQFWVQLIATGEAAGNLPLILERLVTHLEASAKIRGKLLGAMAYPACLFGISLICLFVMMWRVIPEFAVFFKDFGGKLPAVTVFVLKLSSLFAVYGVYVIGSGAALGTVVLKYLRTPQGLRQATNTMLVLPLVGNLAVESSMQRFASSLSLLLKSGTSLYEALATVQLLFRNFGAYDEAIQQARTRVGQGHTLADSLAHTRLFTGLMVNMIRTGEESGELVPVLEQLDIYYAHRVDGMVSTVLSLMEPAIVIFMGGVVGGLLASIYMPMFQMASGSKV